MKIEIMFVKFPMKNKPEKQSFLIISGIRSIITGLRIRIVSLNSMPRVCAHFLLEFRRRGKFAVYKRFIHSIYQFLKRYIQL